MFKNKSLHQIGMYSAFFSVVFISIFVGLLFFGQSFYIQTSINNIIFQLLTLYIGIIITIGMLSTFISSKVQKELSLALDYIKQAANFENLKRENFDILEFQEIAKSTEMMAEEIRTKSHALKELNESLEEKVAQKTAVLEKQNRELEGAKNDIESVVKAQDRFIKSAIHEINTPLAIMRANIELLEMKGEKSKHLSKIASAVKIVTNIYDDLGYFVKKERQADNKVLINFSKFLAERAEYFMEIAYFSNINLELDIEDGLFVHFDSLQLQRVIDNNIYNAIKYSNEQKSIHLSLKKFDDMIVFKMTNNTHSPIDTSAIFDRFSRGQNARGGFGIGLHLVEYICKKNSIAIKVENLENNEVSFEYSFADFLSSLDRMQGF